MSELNRYLARRDEISGVNKFISIGSPRAPPPPGWKPKQYNGPNFVSRSAAKAAKQAEAAAAKNTTPKPASAPVVA